MPGVWINYTQPDQIYNQDTIALMLGALPATPTQSRRGSIVPASPDGRMNNPQPNLLYRAAKKVCLDIVSRFYTKRTKQIHRTRLSPTPKTPQQVMARSAITTVASTPGCVTPKQPTPVTVMRCANDRFKARLGLIPRPADSPVSKSLTPTTASESPSLEGPACLKTASEVQLMSPFPRLMPSVSLRSPFKFGPTPSPEPQEYREQTPESEITMSPTSIPTSSIVEDSQLQLPSTPPPSAQKLQLPLPSTPGRVSPSEQLRAELKRLPSPPMTPLTSDPMPRSSALSTPVSAEMSARQERRFFTRSMAKQKEEEAAKAAAGYNIVPLTKEWEIKVEHALKNGHGEYSTHDLIKVVPPMGSKTVSAWLNDETINGYLKLVTDLGNKGQKTGVPPKYHAFTSFFMTNLLQKGYEGVSRWSKRAKIGGKQLLDVQEVFVPINSNSHWTMLVVSPKNKTVKYYDSLGYVGCGAEYVAAARKWLKGELGAGFKEDEWVTDDNAPSSRQSNGSDCGVFAITSAKQLMLGRSPTDYGPAEIPMQRRRIVAELINGKLM